MTPTSQTRIPKGPREREERQTGNSARLRAIHAVCGLIVLSIAALVGCSSIREVPSKHIVMINDRGNPVDPTGNFWCTDKPPCNGSHLWLASYPEMQRNMYATYLSALFDEMKSKAPVINGKKQLLLFIHGGMNTQRGTIERVEKLNESIRNSITNEEGYYPIFINWQSSLFSSYYDHLLHLRKGWDRYEYGIPGAPFYLLTDLTRSIVRAPIVWSFLLWSDICSLNVVICQEEADATHVVNAINNDKNNHDRRQFDLMVGSNNRTAGEEFRSIITWIVTLPSKIVLAPIIDAFGKSAWDVMLRRTDLLFHTDDDFTTKSQVANEAPTLQDIHPNGGLSVFMRRLQEEIARDGGAQAWDITLVGHSMGTIVLNHLIQDFGLSASGPMPFNRIVFMAGAATLKDYEDSMFPYLIKNPHAQFYHLTLNPRAELIDKWELSHYMGHLDPAPRGSLLVWVDEFLANPGTPHDRTVGRLTNLMVGLHNTPEALRDRIHIKAFQTGAGVEETDPQHHGEFSAPFKFWKSECWEPKQPSSSTCLSK